MHGPHAGLMLESLLCCESSAMRDGLHKGGGPPAFLKRTVSSAAISPLQMYKAAPIRGTLASGVLSVDGFLLMQPAQLTSVLH